VTKTFATRLQCYDSINSSSQMLNRPHFGHGRDQTTALIWTSTTTTTTTPTTIAISTISTFLMSASSPSAQPSKPSTTPQPSQPPSDLPEEDCPICRDTLNVTDTIRDEVPVKIKCGHCFHYGCLTTLINDLSKFSNLCPNCRQEVCKRRPRCLKNGKTLDDVQAMEADGANMGEQERYLQDKHGDFVMAGT
jgi:hypothetical protein